MRTDEPYQGLGGGVGEHRRMHLAVAFEQAKDDGFAGRPTASLAFANATKVALINLHPTVKKRRLLGQAPGDHLAQLVVKQRRRMPVHTHQRRRRPRRCASHKLHDQGTLNRVRKTTFPATYNHMINKPSSAYLGQPLNLSTGPI